MSLAHYISSIYKNTVTTAHPTLLQSLNQFGVDLAFWDLANAQDATEIEASLSALADVPELPSAVAQALEVARVQLPVWSETAQSDPTAAMDALCEWYSQTELLCAQGQEPVATQMPPAAEAEMAASPSLPEMTQVPLPAAVDSKPATGHTNAKPPERPTLPPAAGHGSTRIELHVGRDGDLLREFCNEANELLTDIEQGLLTLETTPDDRDVLNAIFRAFHTFKGGAGMLKLLPIQHLAHQLESILDKARNGLLTVDSNVVSLVLQASDGVGQAVIDILAVLDSGEQQSFIDFDSHAVLDNVARVLRGDSVVVTPQDVADTPSQGDTPVSAQVSTPTTETDNVGPT